MRALMLLLLVCGTASAAPWTGMLDPARAIDWTRVGIPGGIPSRSTICATVSSTDSTATIQSAIDNCPSGQVVYFSAGTYTLTSSIGTRNTTEGITLRGAGPQSTIINIAGSIVLGHWQNGGYPANGHAVSWTGGLTRGSTVLTVSSTSGLAAGQTVILDEHKTGWQFTDGFQGDCDASPYPNTCGRLDASPWFWGGGGPRPAGQMNKIVSVDSSTQITVKDPVAYTHTAGLTPQVFFWDTSGVGQENKEYIGVENMTVYSGANSYTIDLEWCDYCWVKNVAIPDMQIRGAIRAYWSYGFEIRNNYIASDQPDNTVMYGIEILMSSMGLVENNIAFHVTNPYMTEASFGIVFGYNFHEKKSPNGGPCPTCQYADSQPHLSHSMFLLFEGNTWATLDVDNIWGSSSHGTIFRNRFDGVQPGKTQTRRALEISAHQRFYNVIGNVLGDTSVHTVYRCRYVAGNTNTNDGAIYDLGEWHSCGWDGTDGGGGIGSYDATTFDSMVRWGNWDAVTYNASGGTAKGTRWCTGSGTGSSGADAYNTACTQDDRGSDATFPPLASLPTTLPVSLYTKTTGVHASCGTMLPFWKNPGSGYCPAFPPIGPDVSCGSNCLSNAANHATKIPAQLCYEATTQSADGHLTAFDADNCYSADTGAKPNVPTGVH